MEIQHGRDNLTLDVATLRRRLSGYTDCLIDLGTGDGRFTRRMATQRPDRFVMGVDACREQLRAISRRALPNELYVIANALALPHELAGLASHVTINFPWGALLDGLLHPRSPMLACLVAITRPGALIEARLNGGALTEVGLSLTEGAARVRQALRIRGFDVSAPVAMDARALHACPTTWAKRLAFGRDPRAIYLCCRRAMGQ
ncbi:MAG: hypothetical protein ACRDHE_16200 [Ktedonobacterales bacterium]